MLKVEKARVTMSKAVSQMDLIEMLDPQAHTHINAIDGHVLINIFIHPWRATTLQLSYNPL